MSYILITTTARQMAGEKKMARRKMYNPLRRRRRKRSRRRKNPIDVNQDLLGGVSIKDLGYATAAVAGLNLLENTITKYFNLDLSGFGRLGTAVSKLGLGIGGALLAEQAGILSKNSELDKMIKLAAVFGAVQDIAVGLVEQLSGVAESFGLGELISHPASQGSVSLSEFGLGGLVDAMGQPAVTGMGYTANQYGDPQASLGGAFYAGNASLPQGAAQQPDFMNMVPGRSDLSAVPDFMR